ncbi:hypothetical protein O181_034988 [Austropuccinia psidii MF-1]|uniref:Integrase catalytic domain-containing protein n=1 Tax=Austropuccinia psidii MF-1 TaxID=1389203 RepID=A0A9Q3D4K7_9BASI|nr:hypothetical protein [Austropuccinia psidii MF-1]
MTPVTNKWNKENLEAISIISSRVSHHLFIKVVKKYSTNAQQLWTILKEQYASKKVSNRGHFWMQWLRSLYDGNIQSYIDKSRILIMSLETVNINIPAKCHSFTLLVLERLQDYHENSRAQVSNQVPAPTTLVSESAHPYKIMYYCTNGKHNPMCTTHTKESSHLSTAQALMTRENIKIDPQELIIDCGATHQMINSRSLFSSFIKTSSIGVCTGDSASSLLLKVSGTVDILINNLLRLCKGDLVISRSGALFTLKSDEKFGIKGRMFNNLMRVEYTLPSALVTGTKIDHWHQQLGHPVGLISPSCLSGNKYFLTIVDQSTSFKIVQLLKHKSEAFKQFVIVMTYMKDLHDKSLKNLVSDRGGEFMNSNFKLLAEMQGFLHVFSPPNTPQNNGYAKQANRTILKKTRCLLNSSGLPNHYWAKALNMAVFLSNLIPTPSIFNLSPYSLLTGNPP